MIQIRGKYYVVHHVAWKEYRGEIPPDKKILMSCENAACFAPDHLYAGDQRYASKLNKKEVAEIKRRRAGGERLQSLADAFGMSLQRMSSLNKGIGKQYRRTIYKLTKDQIKQIRKRRATGERLKYISADFHVTDTTIIKASEGVKWWHPDYRCRKCGHQWIAMVKGVKPLRCKKCHCDKWETWKPKKKVSR